MRRLIASWRFLVTLGLGITASGLSVRECSADGFGFLHPHRIYYSKTTTVGGAPMVVMPSGMTPTVPVGQPYPFAAPPVLHPGAVASGSSPLAPGSSTSRSRVERPRSPYQHLFGFSPESPSTPAVATADGLASHNLGQRIFNALKALGSALVTDQGGQGSPLQVAIDLFGDATGYSPVAQDVEKLAKMVASILAAQKPAGGGSATTPTVTPTGGDAGVSTITITITVQGSAKINVSPAVVTPPTPVNPPSPGALPAPGTPTPAVNPPPPGTPPVPGVPTPSTPPSIL